MDKCKEYEATVRDYVAMANDNSQLQIAYQQGTASLDHNSLKKQKFTGRGRRNRSNSGSRERRPQNKPNGTKCKRCGFEHHTTTDGSCPALKSTCGFCKIVGHYESACIKKRTEKKREGTDKRVSSNMFMLVIGLKREEVLMCCYCMSLFCQPCCTSSVSMLSAE